MKQAINIRSERFEVAFNQIHLELKKLVKNEPTNFTNLVYKGSQMFSLIHKYDEELHQLARLRNAIVHDKYELGQYIAEPHEETVARIEHIAKAFTKPQQALSIATTPVITYQYEDSIERVIHGIHQHSYSQYPIYQGDKCIGLLTAKTVVKWMAANIADSIVDLSTIKVSDLFTLEQDHPIAFAPRSTNIFELEEIFEKAYERNNVLEAVIITKDGRMDQQPLGVVTSWDLIEIEN